MIFVNQSNGSSSMVKRFIILVDQSSNLTTNLQAKSQSDSASIDKSVHEDPSSIISQAPQANPLINTDDSDAAMTTNLNE